MTDAEIIEHATYLNTEAGRRAWLACFAIADGDSCDLTGDDDDADGYWQLRQAAHAPEGCDVDSDDEDHDGAHICSGCAGSGEGYTDGSKCWSCRGSGDDRGWRGGR